MFVYGLFYGYGYLYFCNDPNPVALCVCCLLLFHRTTRSFMGTLMSPISVSNVTITLAFSNNLLL